MEGGKPDNLEKNPRSKARTNNKNSIHLCEVRGERLSTAPPVLSDNKCCLFVRFVIDLKIWWITFHCQNTPDETVQETWSQGESHVSFRVDKFSSHEEGYLLWIHSDEWQNHRRSTQFISKLNPLLTVGHRRAIRSTGPNKVDWSQIGRLAVNDWIWSSLLCSVHLFSLSRSSPLMSQIAGC